MSYYRLYFLTAENRISRFVELFDDCDEQAIRSARSQAEGHPTELWNRDRLVARLPAEDGARREALVHPPVA